MSKDILSRADECLEVLQKLRGTTSDQPSDQPATVRANVIEKARSRVQSGNVLAVANLLPVLPPEQRVLELNDAIEKAETLLGDNHDEVAILKFLRVPYQLQDDFQRQECLNYLSSYEGRDDELAVTIRINCHICLSEICIGEDNIAELSEHVKKLRQITREPEHISITSYLQSAAHLYEEKFRSAIEWALACISHWIGAIDEGLWFHKAASLVGLSLQSLQEFGRAADWFSEALSWMRHILPENSPFCTRTACRLETAILQREGLLDIQELVPPVSSAILKDHIQLISKLLADAEGQEFKTLQACEGILKEKLASNRDDGLRSSHSTLSGTVSPEIKSRADFVLNQMRERRLSYTAIDREAIEIASKFSGRASVLARLLQLPGEQRLPALDIFIAQAKATLSEDHPTTLLLEYNRLDYVSGNTAEYRLERLEDIFSRLRKLDNMLGGNVKLGDIAKRAGIRKLGNIANRRGIRKRGDISAHADYLIAHHKAIKELCQLSILSRQGEQAMVAADRLEQVAGDDHDKMEAFLLQGTAFSVQKKFGPAIEAVLKSWEAEAASWEKSFSFLAISRRDAMFMRLLS
ncbi:uncharacterized protein LMH87_007563 [Akanthomyces muscarius]|uniref:Uncharacterized protein n=1 Tax=Akanthomyces muscarius TaxID=2231603 RepID=A0A9W8QLW2_AKAMU|nr:uncharacterized protein LMH87_007563 [Akanthomyces muscarius]KAJ4161527.1 hypothetical protein LMH87_007563 [Akanthomyces muscarius]